MSKEKQSKSNELNCNTAHLLSGFYLKMTSEQKVKYKKAVKRDLKS